MHAATTCSASHFNRAQRTTTTGPFGFVLDLGFQDTEENNRIIVVLKNTDLSNRIYLLTYVFVRWYN